MRDYREDTREARIWAQQMQRKQGLDVSGPATVLLAVFSKRYRMHAQYYLAYVAMYFAALAVIAMVIAVGIAIL